MKTETPREIAERIANEFLLAGSRTSSAFGNDLESQSLRRLLTDAIQATLNAERKRAIEITNRYSICRDHDQPSHCVQCDLRHKAIAEIRGKD